MYSDQNSPTSESDVVWGAANIGRVINRPPRQTFYLLEKGLLPARKIGDAWVSTRTELRAAMRGAPASQVVEAV